MSIQDIIDKKDQEIEILHKVLILAPGYNIDLFGEMLYIRSHCDGYEVGWEAIEDGMQCNWHKEFAYDESMDAVIFFVEKRYELQLGIDFEQALMKAII